MADETSGQGPGGAPGRTSVLQVRDVPAGVRAALKEHAAAAGTSLNRHVLAVLAREAATPTTAQVLDRAQRRAERARASAASLPTRSPQPAQSEQPERPEQPQVDVREPGGAGARA